MDTNRRIVLVIGRIHKGRARYYWWTNDNPIPTQLFAHWDIMCRWFERWEAL